MVESSRFVGKGEFKILKENAYRIGLMLRLIGPAIEILGFYFLFGAKDKPRSIGGVPTEKLLWGVLAVGLSMVVIGILLSSKRPKIS